MVESTTQHSGDDNREAGEEKPIAEPKPSKLFRDLITTPALRDAVAGLGFETATDVQALTLPGLVTGRDAIVQAKTGSGKTLSYLLPVLDQILQLPNLPTSDTKAIIIAPTRELASQIGNVMTSLKILPPAILIGGLSLEAQREQLRRQATIVIGTPGRLLELLREKTLDLRRCKHFVLDEADEMLSMGFVEDVRAILSRLPAKRQGVFVSATIPPRVGMLVRSFLDNPELLCVDDPADSLPEIEHLYCQTPGDLMAKPTILCDIIETYRPRTAIVFCNTKSDTEMVEALLRRRGFDARRINSDLSQKQRDRIMRQIRGGQLQLLIATDIAARGLDLDQLDLVVNYSIHEQSELYVHRTGRTGRAGHTGRAISLVGPRDFGFFHHLTKVLPIEFKQMTAPTDEDIVTARVAHLYEILRTNSKEPTQRDLLVATKVLSDCGLECSPQDQAATILAQLAQVTTEHLLQSKPPALEEEVSEDREASENESEQHPRQRRTSRERGEGHDSRDRRSETPKDSVKLYISQGREQGLNSESLTALIVELAEVEQDNVRDIHIRDNCSFVVTPTAEAEKILSSMHGIEYNGAQLTVERAASQSRGRGRSGERRSSRDTRGRDRGRERGRRDSGWSE